MATRNGRRRPPRRSAQSSHGIQVERRYRRIPGDSPAKRPSVQRGQDGGEHGGRHRAFLDAREAKRASGEPSQRHARQHQRGHAQRSPERPRQDVGRHGEDGEDAVLVLSGEGAAEPRARRHEREVPLLCGEPDLARRTEVVRQHVVAVASGRVHEQDVEEQQPGQHDDGAGPHRLAKHRAVRAGHRWRIVRVGVSSCQARGGRLARDGGCYHAAA